jgi:histidine triad (HIT) family protein
MDNHHPSAHRAGNGHREPHCTFCDLIHGAAEVSICHEDSDAIAFMDIQPVNNGHVLVVPRQHYESLLDVPQELGLHLFQVTMRLANAVRHVTGCEDLNIVVNSGKAAGQDEPHYHVHIIPRRDGDGFDIQLPFNGSEMPDRTVLDAYAARIIAALRDPMRVSSPEGNGGAAQSARPETKSAPAERSSYRASDDAAERAVALPTFDESAHGTRASQSSGPSGAAGRRGGRWRAFEGAHGELQYEPAAEASDEK